MRITTILPLVAALAPILISSCSLDPEYREWKKKQKSAAEPAMGTTNPYGVPQASGDAGSYNPQAPGAAPYQPLPGVAQPAAPVTPAPYPAPAAPTAPAAGGVSHTVVAGDSLWGLARKYGTTIEAIQAANALTTTSIRTGQTLTIPGR